MKDTTNPLSRPPIGPLEEELIQVMDACERMLDGITAHDLTEPPRDGLSQLLEAWRQGENSDDSGA